MDEPWVEYNGSSITNRIYLHSDHQGSIIALSDNTSNVTAKFSYDAFGIPANNNSDTFGYTGQLYFKDIGLDYYKARIYSPKLGRFLQTDPIGYKDDMDLYSYVGNDPLNKTDPTGKCYVDKNDHVYGICGDGTRAEIAFANKMLKDKNSHASEMEKKLVDSKKLVIIRIFDRTAPSKASSNGDPTDGSAQGGADGKGNMAAITINSNKVTVHDANGKEHKETMEEKAEHELGHASDIVGFTQKLKGDSNTAIKFENEYREKMAMTLGEVI